MESALVIMAAGLGTRFGTGIKQLTPVGPAGEMIIDYSVHDALEAGFTDIVFIIRPEIEPLLRELLADRLIARIGAEHVRFVYQSPEDLPEGFSLAGLAPGRTKPWGTGHAIYACRKAIRMPFAVINADDYYGKEAFRTVHDYLEANAGDGSACCMAGFVLRNTLSEFGTVKRGVCTLDENGYLVRVTETAELRDTPEGTMAGDEPIAPDTPVSMNMWGLTPKFLEKIEESFRAFLTSGDPMKDEFFLPTVVTELLEAGEITVRCLRTEDKWFGVTYAADKPMVMEAFRKLTEQGIYPPALWNN